MSRKGDCYDNAVAESFFPSLKREMENIDDLGSWAGANLDSRVHRRLLQFPAPALDDQLEQSRRVRAHTFRKRGA
jgi:transposase InsO family protein